MTKSKTTSFILIALLTCMLLAGCGHKLSGRYISESSNDSIRFSSDGNCTFYEDGSYYNGTYYWSAQEGCYYLDVSGLSFKATPSLNGLVVTKSATWYFQADYSEYFKRDGVNLGLAGTVVLVTIIIFLLIGGGIVFLVIVLTRPKKRISIDTMQKQKADSFPQVRYCTGCGTAYSTTQNYCKKCGQKLR